jgi:hypothetical protein
MLAGLIEGNREIVVAEGRQLGAIQLRMPDSDQLYALVVQEGARLAALRESLGSAAYLDPSRRR